MYPCVVRRFSKFVVFTIYNCTLDRLAFVLLSVRSEELEPLVSEPCRD